MLSCIFIHSMPNTIIIISYVGNVELYKLDWGLQSVSGNNQSPL